MANSIRIIVDRDFDGASCRVGTIRRDVRAEQSAKRNADRARAAKRFQSVEDATGISALLAMTPTDA